MIEFLLIEESTEIENQNFLLVTEYTKILLQKFESVPSDYKELIQNFYCNFWIKKTLIKESNQKLNRLTQIFTQSECLWKKPYLNELENLEKNELQYSKIRKIDQSFSYFFIN